ncbi:MAG: DnaA regulatory inactivator Hda [Pseudomonadota bacterium]
MASQLPLGIELKPTIDFSRFISGQNAQAVARLRSGQDPFIYLWGESGCGKSHLLQAACRQQDAEGARCAYLPPAEITGLSPEMLEGLESMDLVCLDDLEQLLGDPTWELALFNLFNQLRDHRAQLFIAANAPPGQLPVKLKDLASRLTWGPCYHLIPLNDPERLELLISSAEQRGLKLSPETAGFLLQRTPRDIHSLTRLVERLDQASLAEQRRLTTPFVRKVLGL